MGKIRVGVVFGGKSPEHEVSLVSAQSVIAALDPAKYEVVPIGISKQGQWVVTGDPMKILKQHASSVGDAVLESHGFPLTVATGNSAASTVVHDRKTLGTIDVFFPVLHGAFGEDGSIQGLFEMFGVPYVGCDVLSSALGMDKIMQKTIWTVHQLPLVKYLPVSRADWDKNEKRLLREAMTGIGLPCFVKPALLGSSIGISKVKEENALGKAMAQAFEYSDHILVEQGIDAREIECAVLGNEQPRASVPGEIVVGGEFYDFADKYLDQKSHPVIPADLTPDQVARVQSLALRAYTTLGCSGMARVDFFLDRATGTLYLNEINTIPGFTSISMYPKLWEASGMPYASLLDELIRLARERFAHRKNLKTSFESASDWYKKT